MKELNISGERAHHPLPDTRFLLVRQPENNTTPMSTPPRRTSWLRLWQQTMWLVLCTGNDNIHEL